MTAGIASGLATGGILWGSGILEAPPCESNLRVVTESNLRVVTESNPRGVTGSNPRGVTGSNLRVATESNLRVATESNLRVATESNLRVATESNPRGVTESNLRVVTGFNPHGVTESNLRPVTESNLRPVTMTAGPSLVWFRQDLRVADNPALQAALARGGPVLPVYVWAPEEEGEWTPGRASRWWLHHSLESLDASLRERRSRLVVRRGPSLRALLDLAADTGAEALFWNRRYEPAIRARDAEVEEQARGRGLAVETSSAALLFEPPGVVKRDGQPFQVFTPFWKACLARDEPAAPLPAPGALPAPRSWPETGPPASLGLHGGAGRLEGPDRSWRPGESGAARELSRFLRTALAGYPRDRERPDREGTSRLSPHLHFGEIGARQVWHAVGRHAARRSGRGTPRAAEAFVRQLGWREFAHHLLFHFPHTTTRPLRAEFAAFPWAASARALEAWQRGRTGYPLVDAGMRQLLATGWMHNRARMVAASFLVKHLLLRWQAGARWFWDALVDADLANNTLGWQWTAGSGADAAPYFRIFNPVSQGRRFDPDGDYVRRWVPELARLPARWIHAPWEASPAVLKEARVKIGRTYPAPMVGHGEARQRALAAFAAMRRKRRA